MVRHMLKWFFPSCLALTLSVLSLPARAQHNFKTVQDIPANRDLKPGAIIPMSTTYKRGNDDGSQGVRSRFSGSVKADAGAASHNGTRFPADVQYHGGSVIDTATQHALFVNPSKACPANSCWGDPIGFLTDLGYSRFIHVSDQYVNSDDSNRYPVGSNFIVPGYAPSAGAGMPFTNLDLALAAYFIASQTGGFGDNNIYHLFLVPGQDVCYDNTFTQCYSPDNSKTFAFCAYHSHVVDSAGNVVVYTVEPYQDVPGCKVAPNTPNGQVEDSTNNVLSHETFETITDPHADAWWNSRDNGIYGEEIADECQFLLFTATDVFFDPALVRLNHKLYAAQQEYSNLHHACVANASD